MLFDAVNRNDKGALEALLKTNSELVNAKDDKGVSVLYRAVADNHEDLVTLLLENKADVNIRNANGFTPLIIAADDGNLELATLLINKGADVNAKLDKGIIGITPLMCAVSAGHEAVVRLLLEHGADVNAKANNGATALMLAFGNGQKQIENLLLDHGADLKQVLMLEGVKESLKKQGLDVNDPHVLERVKDSFKSWSETGNHNEAALSLKSGDSTRENTVVKDAAHDDAIRAVIENLKLKADTAIESGHYSFIGDMFKTYVGEFADETAKERERLAAEYDEKARMAEVATLERKKRFEAEQKAKGLVQYEGQWMTTNEAIQAQQREAAREQQEQAQANLQREQAAANAAEQYRPKSDDEMIQEAKNFRNYESRYAGTITTWRLKVESRIDYPPPSFRSYIGSELPVNVHYSDVLSGPPDVNAGDTVDVTARFEYVESTFSGSPYSGYISMKAIRVINHGVQ